MMAVSGIHAARTTVSRLIRYIMQDKTETVKSEKEINKQYHHEILSQGSGQFSVQYFTHTNCYRCNSENPYETFQNFEKRFRKAVSSGKTRSKNHEEPLAYHARISFAGHECSQETALEIGEKVANSVFQGFPTVVSVHTNTDNIHLHLAVCAWNTKGKKWNNCHKTTQQLRNVTDQLCREYGLSVLEKTQTMKLIRAESDGKVHYYEDTEHRREHGTPAYVNTHRYQDAKNNRVKIADIVREDIDMLLPHSTSYEDLLDRLRELGYKIRAKKQDGSWMAHISYQPPAFGKAVREDKIGDRGFYCRENLEAVIEKRVADKSLSYFGDADAVSDVPVYEDYRYSKISVQSIREDYYKVRRNDGTVIQRQRSDWQKKAIRSLKKDDLHVRTLLDTTDLWKLVAEQEQLSDRKMQQRADSEAARYVAQIENTFRALHYTEQNDFRSYGQMLDVIKAIHRDHAEILTQKQRVENLISEREKNLSIPNQIAELRDRTKNRDVSYMVERYYEDITQLDKLTAQLRALGLDDPGKIAAYSAKTKEFKDRLDALNAALRAAEARLDDADNCIRTYARIDAENGIDISGAMQRYESILRGEYQIEPETSRSDIQRDREV